MACIQWLLADAVGSPLDGTAHTGKKVCKTPLPSFFHWEIHNACIHMYQPVDHIN